MLSDVLKNCTPELNIIKICEDSITSDEIKELQRSLKELSKAEDKPSRSRTTNEKKIKRCYSCGTADQTTLLHMWKKGHLQWSCWKRDGNGHRRIERVDVSYREVSKQGTVSKGYWAQRKSLCLCDCLLHRKWMSSGGATVIHQLLVPRARNQEAPAKLHVTPAGDHQASAGLWLEFERGSTGNGTNGNREEKAVSSTSTLSGDNGRDSITDIVTRRGELFRNNNGGGLVLSRGTLKKTDMWMGNIVTRDIKFSQLIMTKKLRWQEVIRDGITQRRGAMLQTAIYESDHEARGTAR
ncbi:hypothetical protein JTB14_001491 [Gonioctena quinquepunctata]|nr:hypothetical protein JTB14_001491 [Gonioctena quinquepunctata]